jgi:polyphosphate kinase 2 (PPK2 family)
VKIMLHISKEYQAERFRKRLDDPSKQWKFNPGDLAERERWPAYMRAYETALGRTSRPWAPWYCVPAEVRWWRDLVVSELLVRTLVAMDPQPPALDYDPLAYPPGSF